MKLHNGIRELYFSIFVLFYRTTGWSGSWKLSSAIMLLTVTEWFFAITVFSYLQKLANFRATITEWQLIIGAVIIYAVTRYFVTYGATDFERNFDNLPATKRRRLLISSGLIIALIWLSFFVLRRLPL